MYSAQHEDLSPGDCADSLGLFCAEYSGLKVFTDTVTGALDVKLSTDFNEINSIFVLNSENTSF